MLIPMVRSIKSAMRRGVNVPLDATDREWLSQRVLVSGWYPFERFVWLSELVQHHLKDGSDEAAVAMGRYSAEQSLGGVHASFIYEGDVERTFRSVPNMWTRYLDFGEVETLVRGDEVTLLIHGYEIIPRVHELMLEGWCQVIVELAGGEVVDSEISRAPSMGDDVYELRLRYRPSA
jgi:hypothetical protein